MAGSIAGGLKAAATAKRKYGEDYYRNIGAKVGAYSASLVKKGFCTPSRGADGLTGPERARIAGQKGGKISKRGKAKQQQARRCRWTILLLAATNSGQ